MENYDWIPPCLNEIEILEFFSHFSLDQVPLNQIGKINRKKNLFRQLPKSDFAIEFNNFLKKDNCNKKSFFNFVSKRNVLAFDIALCLKNSLKNLVNYIFIYFLNKKNV